MDAAVRLVAPPHPGAGERNMTTSEIVLQACLGLFGLIALAGGTLQMWIGQPETTARLDNVHRFMGGVYLSTAPISLWAAWTIREQSTLVYLVALGALLGGCGRLISIARVGWPQPKRVWIAYLLPELVLPWVMFAAQLSRQ
jgi:hypothetical protein